MYRTLSATNACALLPGDVGGDGGPHVLHDGLDPVASDSGGHGGESERPFFRLHVGGTQLDNFTNSPGELLDSTINGRAAAPTQWLRSTMAAGRQFSLQNNKH